ncbi:hypothetical protein [Formosa algae]|uniref:hypothetical protein n=1 Tax=Formosa algae TaxID=225843 RepID=UPI000CCE125A|nr:hypothetical protein [Formosa algae]PNW28571.1 hypothetical protein BKP44_08115 [Formosa algae]
MAQDIRDLFKADRAQDKNDSIPEGHEARFLDKLNACLPETPVKSKVNWVKIAASLVILLGLSFGGYTYLNSNQDNNSQSPTITGVNTKPEVRIKTLGDLSPDLKKVEDYYLASIHTELSKVELTPENKELIDGYIERLEELSNEYKRLSEELTASGPSEFTVNALIDNLKLRLNLLYRLRDQLKTLSSETVAEEATQHSF